MKRVFIIVLTIISVAIITGSGIYFAKSKFNNNQTSNLAKPTESPKEELTSWEDQSGFKFEYPKSLKLNPHEEDQENYAHLELTSTEHEGGLIVWAKDTKLETIVDWAKEAKVQNAIDTTLSEESAKKELINSPDGKEAGKLVTSAIHKGYLYQIDVTLADRDYWNKIYDTVSSTFKFVEPTLTQGATKEVSGKNGYSESNQNEENPQSDLSGGDVQSEGEEVVE